MIAGVGAIAEKGLSGTALQVSNIDPVAVIGDRVSRIDAPCLKLGTGYERFGKRLRTAN
jgi:hypothetical protein